MVSGLSHPLSSWYAVMLLIGPTALPFLSRMITFQVSSVVDVVQTNVGLHLADWMSTRSFGTGRLFRSSWKYYSHPIFSFFVLLHWQLRCYSCLVYMSLACCLSQRASWCWRKQLSYCHGELLLLPLLSSYPYILSYLFQCSAWPFCCY